MTDTEITPQADAPVVEGEGTTEETPTEEITAESIAAKFAEEQNWGEPEDPFEEELPEEGEEKKPSEPTKKEAPKEAEEIDEEIEVDTAFLGDKSYDVPLEAEITVKVNGKLESVKISELKSNWSGKVHYDKKFSDLANRERVFQDQVRKADNILESFFKASTEAPVLALTFQDTAKGMPLKQSLKKRYEELATDVVKYAKMTEEQREDYLDRIAFQKDKQEFEVSKRKAEETEVISKAQQMLNTQLSENGYTMQDYDLAIEEMTQAVTEKIIEPPKTAEELVKKAVDWIRASKLYSKVSSIGAKSKASQEEINLVFKQSQDLGVSLTEEDITEIFSSISSDTNAQKTHKAGSKPKPKVASPKGKGSASRESESEEVDEEALAIARNMLSIAY